MMTFVFLGFCAQLIDGCLGMAYGVFLTTFLMANGVPLVNASSSIHFSEVFTSLVSGISHWKFKNIDWLLFKKLVISGIVGGVMGGGRLIFTERITEGRPCCMARLQSEVEYDGQ